MDNLDAIIGKKLAEEGRLFKAIRDAYEEELLVDPETAIEKHCYGVMSAIHEVYVLGMGEGYRQGYEKALAEAGKDKVYANLNIEKQGENHNE